MSVSLTTERIGTETCIITATGELDIYTAPEFRDQIARALETDGTRVVVIDLTRTSFLDSSALGVLIGALRRVREQNGELRIAAPPAPVRKVFEITSLDQVFNLHASRNEALSGS
jgi:anti-sigma B factor antagonist